MLFISSEKLKSLLSYGAVFLIILGSLRLIIYFGAFNIQISRYLEISEIVGAFLNDLLFIGMVFLFINLFDFLFTTNLELQTKNEQHLKYLGEKSFIKRMMYNGNLFSTLIFLNLIFAISFLVVKYLLKKSSSAINIGWAILNMQLICGVLLQEYKRRYFQLYNRRLDISTGNILLYSIIITFLLISRTYSDIYATKEAKQFIKTRIKINDVEMVSDSTNYYIGQTKNFIFIYNEKLGETSVYPMSEVKEIHFVKKK